MELKQRIQKLAETLAISEKEAEIEKIKEEIAKENSWQNDNNLIALSQKLTRLTDVVDQYKNIFELSEVADDDDLKEILPEIERLEKQTYFKEPHDASAAILQIFSGAGGVDAQDWASMLLKMYLRLAERRNWQAEVAEVTNGNEAGIKNATIIIRGENIFGQIKNESGVHRLVRLSPFNAKNLRQTSFALVEIIPEVADIKEAEINSNDLKVEVFRSSGHGGQSVNTTDSAVRLTHIPTGISASCQNQRSQNQNRESALKILSSRLLDRLRRERKENIVELRGEVKSNEWGSQVRSYILHPYKLVKDHRTNVSSNDPVAVLSGDLNKFLDAERKD